MADDPFLGAIIAFEDQACLSIKDENKVGLKICPNILLQEQTFGVVVSA